MTLLVLLAGSSSALYANLLFIGVMLGVFYFMILRPQSQRQAEQKSFLTNLQRGQNVVTIGGLHGKITKIDGNIIQLLVDTKTYLNVERDAISIEWSKKAGSSTTPTVSE
jgi:preprotein translocase subunit YajC